MNTQTAPSRKPSSAGDRLEHVWFVDRPKRTLCGKSRDLSDPGQQWQENSAMPYTCVVCEELANAYLEGSWPG